MFRRLNPIALALLAALVASKPSFAASLAQTSTPGTFDQFFSDPNALWIGTIVLVLALVIGSGIILSLLTVLLARFLNRNVPAADKLAEFNAKQTAAFEQERNRPPKPITISPTLEPFIISIGGFLIVFIIASLVVVVPTPSSAGGSPVSQATGAPQSSLAVSGDFAKIVAALPAGNADNGAKLFVSEGCSGCHGVQKDQRIVGPSFYGLWGRAATRKPGYGAAEYTYESIVAPNAYIVDGFPANVMPQTFAKLLTPQQVSDILAFIQRDHNEP